jgi:hypothetical protein
MTSPIPMPRECGPWKMPEGHLTVFYTPDAPYADEETGLKFTLVVRINSRSSGTSRTTNPLSNRCLCAIAVTLYRPHPPPVISPVPRLLTSSPYLQPTLTRPVSPPLQNDVPMFPLLNPSTSLLIMSTSIRKIDDDTTHCVEP